MKNFRRWINHRLWKRSGGDFHVIYGCSDRAENVFSFIGLFVNFIAIICFISILLATSLLFQWEYFIYGVPIAFLLTWLVFHIYLVLLLTFSKNVLPSRYEKGNKLFARSLKYIFVIILATFISKPLEVSIFYNQTENKIEEYRKKLYKDIEVDVDKTSTSINNPVPIRINPVENYFKSIQESNFFVQRLLYTMQIPLSWLINLAIIVIFLLPAIVKLFISDYSKDYYKVKEMEETTIIIRGYEEMKLEFTNIMQEKFPDKKFQYYEAFIDPPFNTILKKDRRIFKSQEDFLKRIYGS
jgi:hypothetical protein